MWVYNRAGERGHYTLYQMMGCIKTSAGEGRQGDGTVKCNITGYLQWLVQCHKESNIHPDQ